MVETVMKRRIAVKVWDVLEIAQALDGSLSAGYKGLKQEVRFIEVMEVPEVEAWATEGLLVITTFYAVKDDPERQLDIISALIDKKAAGLVIKVGRFVEKLPDELIELADKHDFPIIAIPKWVAYIDLLTPLYGLLHQEGDTSADNDALHSFKDIIFNSVEEALEFLSVNLNGGAVYIEDMQGLLLYSSGRFYRDPWRKTGLVFSPPTHSEYQDNLRRWKDRILKDGHFYIYLPGKLSRLIIPLYTRQEIFAFIHLPFHNQTLMNSLSKKSIEAIQHKLYEIVMSELVEMQKHCMSQVDEFKRAISNHSNLKAKVVLYFKEDQKLPLGSSRVVDYDCMRQKKWLDLLEQIPNVEQSFIFEQKEEIYVLLILSVLKSVEEIVEEVSNIADHFPVPDTCVGISPVFYHFNELDAKVKAVTNMMEFGREYYPDNKIYSYYQLGIYEFFIKLSQDSSAWEYARQILGPLESEGDPELLETLIMYLQENGNASRAAEKLYVHRRTMTNRLVKIKSLLNMDLDNSEHIFILQFCLKIKRINEQ